jgi:hypothetical protein
LNFLTAIVIVVGMGMLTAYAYVNLNSPNEIVTEVQQLNK